ncbi:MAG: hypothetical protein ACR2OH_06650 [Microthrixaceae bacterium]
MAPAAGNPLDNAAAAAMAGRWGSPVQECYSSDEVASVTRVPQLRVAVALLAESPAAPLLESLLSGESPLRSLAVGPLEQPGRVLGDPETGPEAGVRWLNERYALEHPAVVAPSIAHAICHHEGESSASNAEEATLHGVLAAVHAWLLSQDPSLADLGTELSRRQASLTITLLNARSVGSAVPSMVCPDGPGTIPGGNPDLQCPDLWSIPFTSADPQRCDLGLPAAVSLTLQRLAAPGAHAPPPLYSEALGEWLGESTCRGALDEQVVDRAGRALGLWAA